MDPRTAAHTLAQIAAFLELRGESRYKVRAYEQAARSVAAIETDDLATLDRDGTLGGTRGLGPATLAVVRDLIESGESRYLEQLRGDTPAGLLELLNLPGLAMARIHQLHEALGVDNVDALEAVTRNGKLAGLKGYGPKTAARILRGIELYRASGTRVLYPRGAEQAATMLAAVRAHPDVAAAAVAGSVRRHGETIGDTDIVAACSGDPRAVASSFARTPGTREVARADSASPGITWADGARLDLYCVPPRNFAVALWRATGSATHVTAVTHRLGVRGIVVAGDTLVDSAGTTLDIPDEMAIYAAAGLPFIPPEMREDGLELTLASRGRIPALLEPGQIRGALHCHTTYSDGRATLAEMVAATRAKGWSYIGVTDHSRAAAYARGLSREQVLAQHAEIDALNDTFDDFRILKGIEADILADGTLDYDAALLDRFDFVIGSVHSHLSMDSTTMTARMLRALDDPHLTILGHPTGRLLLSRAPSVMDVGMVLDKAGYLGVAVELNADPKRLDLDWRLIPQARAAGVMIEIGPDAHSTKGLDTMDIGVGIARKAGVEAHEVLNTLPAGDVLAFARARREREF